MKKAPKPIIVERNIKHTFTSDEIAALNVDFRNAYDAVKSAEADFDSVKAVHKAKITEAESKMTTLRATINAGFEYRKTKVEVRMNPLERTKDFWDIPERVDRCPAFLFTENMTEEDFQLDLIRAEEPFEKRCELELWNAGADVGLLIIGRYEGSWFSAIRAKVGAVGLEERLDTEQTSFKVRFDAVKRAAKRCLDWVEDNFGDEAKGFQESIDGVVEGEKDKVE